MPGPPTPLPQCGSSIDSAEDAMGVVGSYPARYQDSPSIETDGSALYVSKSQPEPGLGRVKTSDSRSAVNMPSYGVGCNRKALYAMVADRALPVLMVGICGLGSKEIRGVGRYEGHSGAERMRSGERDWGERAGFDPASATLRAVASRGIEGGSAFPPHHANTGVPGAPASARRLFLARVNSCPDTFSCPQLEAGLIEL